MANYYDEYGNLSEQEPGPDWNAGMRPPLSGAPTNPYAGDLPPGPARDGYQWVKNPTTGEWEEHSTVPDVPDNPADRPPGSSMPPVTPPVIPPGTGTTGGTPAEIEAQGRAYDRANGLVGGYMRNGVWVNGSPSSSAGGTTKTIGAPSGTDETRTAFDWPGYQSAGPFTPRNSTFDYTPFSYDPYTASSWSDAEKEPGYEASRGQLKKQIESGAANRGMLRSGMTLGDLYTGLDSLGQQNFSNFDNRNFRNYSANRENAFGNWSGNLAAKAQKFGLELGVDKDIYDRNATDVDRGNNYRYNVASSQFQDMLSRWQEKVRSLTNITAAGLNS
ncbi:hypothetical protein UFOVP1601_47 [uncultured Caudovirales phage]|uniref:Uncharacterized protein n=3 Tax=uncultured Caudovirales phage TaxID=2100421 RepID=A0A6J5SV58_9CAUD|nr:hypothetical protein UFOVP1341_36 [uncultured Caudovirales phage]CAB4218886.1 hypothetical protein UFOVP1601_47 [uncultured Caudovirales phage]